MNLFVTLGTTRFDELVEAIDTGPHATAALLQIADGLYVPTVARWERFVDDVHALASAADIVVTHAGAGSVFGLLQAGLQPVVVPNLSRRDGHQAELARWLETNRYANVANTVHEVNDRIARHDSVRATLRPFDVERFRFRRELNAELRTAVARVSRE